MGKSRTVSEIRIKFHLGRPKERGKRGVLGQKPKMRVNFTKFPLLIKIQTLSQKRFVRHSYNHDHCNWHSQKPKGKDFQVILSSSSWSKAPLCIFKEKYGFHIGNAMEKRNSILTRKRKEILWKKYCFDSVCQQRKALSNLSLSTPYAGDYL